MGDSFAAKSYDSYFQQRKSIEYNFYTKAHFDTKGFFHNDMSDNPSVIARLSSLVHSAAHARQGNLLLPLPKLVVIVIDNNLINALGKDISKSVSKAYSKMLNFVMTEFDRCIASFKENLPVRCVKNPGYPYFLWIQAPRHCQFPDNSQRFKFNRCLEEVVKLHVNSFTLALKKGWDSEDLSLYNDGHKYTTKGYISYWEAVDKPSDTLTQSF